jgi:MoxR-like ATPase
MRQTETRFSQADLTVWSQKIAAARDSLATVIRGKDDVLKDVLTCLLANGHLLIEDIPGVGKTTLAYALAKTVGGSFSRIQFTNDLLPADILGVSVYEQDATRFAFHRGPIFANFVLADEINRTTPKTQSSLLECMERSQISIEGSTHPLPQPFMVIATQNPMDFEGTFPLPENQLDRFLMRISMGYPSLETEKTILQTPHPHYDDLEIEPVLTLEDVDAMQRMSRKVYVESAVLDYLMGWVSETRKSNAFRLGISTRGAIALKRAAQARALVENRSFVIPEDIETVVPAVTAHRIISADTWHQDNRDHIRTILAEIGASLPKP